MDVIFDKDEALYLKYSLEKTKKMPKQDAADYLMGKFDEGKIYWNTPINERQLMLSYLPFMHSISFYDPVIELQEYQFKVIFKPSSLMNISPVTLKVSEEMYNFFYNR